MCHKGRAERGIEVNHKLRRYKAQARERLLSEEGVVHRKKRAIEPEAVFGQLKGNNRFTRFRLRTLAKVEVDFALAAISHTLRKLAGKLKEKQQACLQLKNRRIAPVKLLESQLHFFCEKISQIKAAQRKYSLVA